MERAGEWCARYPSPAPVPAVAAKTDNALRSVSPCCAKMDYVCSLEVILNWKSNTEGVKLGHDGVILFPLAAVGHIWWLVWRLGHRPNDTDGWLTDWQLTRLRMLSKRQAKGKLCPCESRLNGDESSQIWHIWLRVKSNSVLPTWEWWNLGMT